MPASRAGSPVMQGDADTDLHDYPSQVFDVVILSQTIQATRRAARVLEHLLRIGRRTIVSLPNFGHWRVRLSLLVNGRMPQTQALGYAWYDTPNIHLCTIADFVSLAAGIERRRSSARWRSMEGVTRARCVRTRGDPIIFAEGAIFLLRQR